VNIAVIGTGYVGLVTGIYLAETGNEVICVDIDDEKVEKIQSGILPVYEPQLDVLFDLNIKAESVTCLSIGRKEVNI
jgi:UDPglucose 6-dehydrogenase